MIITDGIHLGSDLSLDELHEFAQRIGLKRTWFQNHLKHPHYDLTTQRMALKAISHGAKQVSTRQFLLGGYMSYCKKCANRGLLRRVKRKNRIKVNGIWVHKVCPE